MAFRIHDSTVHGEIDDRLRGILHGTIWLEGGVEPIGIAVIVEQLHVFVGAGVGRFQEFLIVVLAATLGRERHEDKDLDQFLFEFETASAKLSGALTGLARGERFCDASFNVACLKRALDHLHKAQAGLVAVTPKKLLPAAMLTEARQELLEIREDILKLMDDFRQQE